MKKLIAAATVLLLVASGCTSADPVALSDAQTTWCADFNNFTAIAEAAITAEVDGYEPIEAEKERIIDELDESFTGVFLGAFMELEWRPDNPVGYSQACVAAYESR
jgi:hypothetical protein